MKACIFGSWGAHWAEIARPRSLNSHMGLGEWWCLQTQQKIAIALPQFIATCCTKLLAKKGGPTWPGTGSWGHSMEWGCYPVFFFLALSLSLICIIHFFMVDAVVWLKLCCERSFQPVLQGPQHGRPPSGKGKGKGGKGGKGSFSESHGGKGTKREAATATTKGLIDLTFQIYSLSETNPFEGYSSDTVLMIWLLLWMCTNLCFFCDPTRSGLLYVMLWGDLCWENDSLVVIQHLQNLRAK